MTYPNTGRSGDTAQSVSTSRPSGPTAAASVSSSPDAAGFSAAQREHKLTLIARQEADELRGWYRAIFQDRHRAPFEGELDAIKRRADQLGLTFKG